MGNSFKSFYSLLYCELFHCLFSSLGSFNGSLCAVSNLVDSSVCAISNSIYCAIGNLESVINNSCRVSSSAVSSSSITIVSLVA